MIIKLKELPKISLNKWYAGKHWTERKKIKDIYRILVRSQTLHKQLVKCNVTYNFYFKTRPLDPSNTIAMVKMIEDIIFPDDSYKIVNQLNITVGRAKYDHVILKIENI